MSKVSKKFSKMSEVYKLFSKPWEHLLVYDDEALVSMFRYESHGEELLNKSTNGYYVGKQWLNVTVAMWKEDIESKSLRVEELYHDNGNGEICLPHWWLDGIFKKGE